MDLTYQILLEGARRPALRLTAEKPISQNCDADNVLSKPWPVKTVTLDYLTSVNQPDSGCRRAALAGDPDRRRMRGACSSALMRDA
jgi:hypothetical protein